MIPTGLYRHYKGTHYQVIGVAKHSETNENVVVYRALYGSFGLWVRPLNMFIESVEQKGKLVPRFELVKEQSPEKQEQSEK